jgi:hypothetical protein
MITTTLLIINEWTIKVILLRGAVTTFHCYLHQTHRDKADTLRCAANELS